MPSFVHPGLLWALLLGLIPIVIYYLMRFRALRVDWGADYVLQRALERLRKKLYLDQLILLALRVLACLALVLVFARPVSRALGGTVSGTRIHRIVIVDGSLSMGAEAGESTVHERQQAILRQLVATWGRGERWSLIVARETPEWLVTDGTLDRPEAAWAELDAIRPTECRADLARALAEAVRGRENETLEIYLSADDQAHSWPAAEAMPPLSPNTRVFWLKGTAANRANLAVTHVVPAWERALAGHPLPLRLGVRNFGPERIANASLDLFIDGTFARRETVALLAGQESTIETTVTIDRPGSHAITARLGRDVLTADNERSAGVQIDDALRLLVLRGPDIGDKFGSAHGFLELAAGLTATGDAWRGAPIQVSVGDAEATVEALTAVHAVVVDAGSSLTPELAERLTAALNQGAGVIFAPDETVDLTRWNALFGELLPAKLAASRVLPLGGDTLQTVANTRLHFYSWLELHQPLGEGAEVLASFADGSPWLVRRRVGRGTVILAAGGLNGRNNNLIVSEQFYPLLVRLALDATGGGSELRNLRPGQPLRYRPADPGSLRAVTFQLDDEPAVALPALPTVTLPGGAAHSGLGSLLLVRDSGENQRIWFGIQGERVDSDLTSWPEAQAAAWERAWQVETAASWDELNERLQAARRGREWQGWVIGALLLILVGELLMQRRFI